MYIFAKILNLRRHAHFELQLNFKLQLKTLNMTIRWLLSRILEFLFLC